MNQSIVFLWSVAALTASGMAIGSAEEELNRFDSLCKTDAEVLVNGHEFKKSGLSYEMITNTIKNTFAGKTQTSKDSGDDALYLIEIAYRLSPELRQEVIREAAYRLCMQEKLSTDR
jgi:hypothetical protein